ncbi:MAG TPA: hypothetical protein ENI94_10015, partial [Gammaproteobacteria bacterium]|nr:hypothetical protein [Gammaproteobacteria bacterium]
MKYHALIATFSLGLLAPLGVQASTFDEAYKQASLEIDKAKAVNYEWRDSRKLLKKAEKLHKEGKTDKAMKLVAKAREQGQLAVLQAEAQ